MTHRFGDFELDVEQRQLTSPQKSEILPETLFRILLLFVTAGGTVVTREQLVKGAWDDGFVTDATITQHVFRLRKLLSAEKADASYIVTEPGQGYRLNAEVTSLRL